MTGVAGIFSALDTAASGLSAASGLLNVSAINIANQDAPNDLTQHDAPSVDLSRQLVNLHIASFLYTANAKVIRAADQKLGSLLDVLDQKR